MEKSRISQRMTILWQIQVLKARIQEKNEPPQNFLVSRFYPTFTRFFTMFSRFFKTFPWFSQCFPDFSQRFPDFSLTKLFKVRKCERCDSLNPRCWYITKKKLFFQWRYNLFTNMDLAMNFNFFFQSFWLNCE